MVAPPGAGDGFGERVTGPELRFGPQAGPTTRAVPVLSWRPMHRFRLTILFTLVVFAACSGVTSLDEEHNALNARERTLVRSQADKALEAGEWSEAWDQEVHAGGDRARLESIALAALKDDSGSAESMFAELRRKWGPLSGGSRAALDTLVVDAVAERDWKRAMEIEITSADDPPKAGDDAERVTFSKAWALFGEAPPNKASDLREMIQDARDDALDSDE